MLVSIIIPVYNVSLYIERCLTSVFNQTYTNIEVIIVDDCTPDDSMSIAQEIISKYQNKNIRLIRHDKNKGLSAARNTGINNSIGEYLYFLDSDDEISIDAIERLITYTSDDIKPDIVIGGVQVIGNYPEVELPFKGGERLLTNDEILNSFLRSEWYVMAWNKLVKRSFVINNNLFFYEGIYHEDLLWSFELAQKAQTLTVCLEKIYKYCIRIDSIFGSVKPKNIVDLLFVFEKIITYSNKNLKMLNTPFFDDFIEGLRFHILFISDSKNRWYSSRDKLLLLRKIRVVDICSGRKRLGTRLKMFLQILPPLISYNLFKCRKNIMK